MTIIETILAIFSGVAGWIVETVPTVTSLFYADGALTFMGVLGIASLSISIGFLLIGIVQRFLRFRA